MISGPRGSCLEDSPVSSASSRHSANRDPATIRVVAAEMRRTRLFFVLLLVSVLGVVIHAQSANPFAGKKLYVDPNSTARRQAETWKQSRPADAALLQQIASQPVARWLGGWVTEIGREVNQAVRTITSAGALPVFVA